MKTKSKLTAYILRGSTAALLFSCVLVALCSAIHVPEQGPKALPPQDNAAFGANAYQNRSLSFADRIAYQRAIEDVYWRHRIWPNTNPGPKPSLDAVMSQAQLEKKVTEYLRNSQALEDDWQRPITADQLQAEMERMASQTKQPDVLRELFEALGDDPFVIAECLARPVLAERLAARTTVAAEPALSASRTGVPPVPVVVATPLRGVARNVPQARGYSERHGAQVPVTMAARSANYTLPVIAGPSGGCIDDTWAATTLTNAPAGRYNHTAVWTGSEMIIWGGTDGNFVFNTGGRYNPITDSWTATSTTNAPSARELHTAVWTGSEMIVWGGYPTTNTGGRYNPTTDSWTATSTTNAPSARFNHTAVWNETGSEMIVWGGGPNLGGGVNTGGRYNPDTDSWTATNTTNAPEGRDRHTAVWSDSEMIMIVWGGEVGTTPVNSGGRYDPATDTWTATSTTNAPSARMWHPAVWSGSEMIVWGGNSFGTQVNTGGKYNPTANTWTATSMINVPSGRSQFPAVWTGSEMIVWGGIGNTMYLNTGGRYDPGTNSWTATSIINAPSARRYHKAVWTGSEMIVWGGDHDGNTGGRYCAAAAGPTPTPTPTPTSSPTPTATATATATITPSPTPTPSLTPRATPTPRPRSTPAPRP
jgi:hypothetical protein